MANPTIKVELSLTDPLGTASWIDISDYVLADGIQVNRGRNSELDRFQAGTATVQLNNNDARFDPTFEGDVVNLITNPSIEVNTTSYLGVGASISRVNTFPANGSWGLLLTTTNVAGSRVEFDRNQLIGLGEGKMYTFSLYASLQAGLPKAFRMYIKYFNGATPLAEYAQDISVTVTTFPDARFSLSAPAPPNTDRATLTLETTTAQGVFNVFTDAWQLEEARQRTAYCDGTVAGCTWTGSAHASTSRRTAPYWPNLRPFNRMRISAIWLSVTYPVYSGYVQSWVPERRTLDDSVVNVPLVDAFAILAIPSLNLTNPAAATDNLTSLPEERSDLRVHRVLDAVDWPSADRVVGVQGGNHPGASTVLAQTELSGVDALSYLQLIERTEHGRLWIDRDGNVVFLDRWAMGQSPYTVNQAIFGPDGSDFRYVQLTPIHDLAFVHNEIRLTGTMLNAQEQVVSDATSLGHYGRRTRTDTGLLVTDNELADAAAWELERYKDARLRFQTLDLAPGLLGPTDQWPSVLSRELSDRIRVKFRPPGRVGTVEQDCFIEGIRHTWTRRDNWRTMLTLSSYGTDSLIYPPGKSFWVLGTSTLTVGNGVPVY